MGTWDFIPLKRRHSSTRFRDQTGCETHVDCHIMGIGLNRPKREADKSFSYSNAVKNAPSYTSTPVCIHSTILNYAQERLL
jgi:hypothetical protein